MIEKTIIILYYLFIINLLLSIEYINKNIFTYIYCLITLYIYSIIFNISYSKKITNMIMFFDMFLSLLIVRELNLITQNKKNICTKLLYYICYVNIVIFIYNIYVNYKYNTVNTI